MGASIVTNGPTRYAKAVGLFQEALGNPGDDPAYRDSILSGLAYARDALEDYKSAAGYFEMIVSSDSHPLRDKALFNLGRLQAALGNAEKSALNSIFFHVGSYFVGYFTSNSLTKTVHFLPSL